MVIPTRDRPEAFARCLAAVGPQVDLVVVVAHMNPTYVGALALSTAHEHFVQIDYAEDPPNISRMWNRGLALSRSWMRGAYAYDSYDVAVLNDDAIVPADWFDTITAAMRKTGAAAGFALSSGQHAPILHTQPRPTNLHTVMTGWAFILDGDKHLFADEQFEWWYGDTSLDWEARTRGGVIGVPGLPMEHLYPNSTTVGELAEIAGQDRQRFAAKHGQTPW